MTFISNEVNNKKYYEEIMYVSNNYYIFKKNPKTKVHSLIKVFILYIFLAEIEGFEPSRPYTNPNSLANCPLQPLG